MLCLRCVVQSKMLKTRQKSKIRRKKSFKLPVLFNYGNWRVRLDEVWLGFIILNIAYVVLVTMFIGLLYVTTIRLAGKWHEVMFAT